jgi:hypothetical protein
MTNKEFAINKLGLSAYRWLELRRAERGLHKWAEQECNGEIQREDESGLPKRYSKSIFGDFTKCLGFIRDSEAYYLAEAKRHAKAAGLRVYHQEDPRGCQIYLYKQSDLDEAMATREIYRRPGMGISALYSSIGTAVC